MCYNEIIMFYITFRVLVLNFLRDYFSEKFYVYNKIEREVQTFSTYSLSPQMHILPHYQNTHHNGTFFFFFLTRDKVTLTYINHPKSSLCLGFTLAVNCFMDLDKHIMTYISIISHRVFLLP